MATLFARSYRLPFLAGAVIFTTAGIAYSSTRTSHQLDSAANGPTSTLLAAPRTMLFAQTLTVTKSEQVSHDTKRITFSLPGGSSQVSGVPAGAAVLTQHFPSGAWLPVLRPYTPISDPDARGTLELMVKKYPKGAASSHLHSLQVGQTLSVRGPVPGYAWTPSSTPRELIFVAGGAGITPLYSLARQILTHPSDKSNIQLLWGVNGTQDIVLKKELETLEKEHPGRLRVTYCVAGPEGEASAPSLGHPDHYRKGFIDRGLLTEVVYRAKLRNWGDEKGTKVWICGPPPMMKALAGPEGILGDLGVDKVHKFQ